MGKKGTLFVVATPIGNLQDITLRALDVLKSVDLVVAEDTRKALALLSHYNIRKPVLSLHRHSPGRRIEEIVRELKGGKKIALISEAGTPGISDPGEELVRRCGEEGIDTVPIPGASALTAALSISGLPTRSFLFFSFPSRKRSKRKKLLEELKEYPHTLVFFESPHRIKETLEDILEIMGDRKVVICREMTKLYEEIYRGMVSEALNWLAQKEIKGEFTVVLEGRFPSKAVNKS
ncbi:16S rRNA (cytidine(1402)-2'-O)-methyltransferase [bacterium]|nr:16S rRNA (cytidine(1402)-2'-O)-methyltransferase [bacterium]